MIEIVIDILNNVYFVVECLGCFDSDVSMDDEMFFS